jgi:hypothetical protein
MCLIVALLGNAGECIIQDLLASVHDTGARILLALPSPYPAIVGIHSVPQMMCSGNAQRLLDGHLLNKQSSAASLTIVITIATSC